MPLFQRLKTEIFFQGLDELGIVVVQVVGDSLSENLVIIFPLLIQELYECFKVWLLLDDE